MDSKNIPPCTPHENIKNAYVLKIQPVVDSGKFDNSFCCTLACNTARVLSQPIGASMPHQQPTIVSHASRPPSGYDESEVSSTSRSVSHQFLKKAILGIVLVRTNRLVLWCPWLRHVSWFSTDADDKRSREQRTEYIVFSSLVTLEK